MEELTAQLTRNKTGELVAQFEYCGMTLQKEVIGLTNERTGDVISITFHPKDHFCRVKRFDI